jgi:ethanolamine ammonia-lyase small subunit
MSTNTLTTERAAIIGVIEPDVNGAAAYDSDEVDMSLWGSIQAVVMAGDFGSSATLDFKLQSATSSGGSFSDVTGKAITQLTQAGTDADKQAVINLRGDELTAGHRYVKAVMTVGTASVNSASIVLGFDARHAPASDNDLSSVDEIVS